MKLNFLKVEVVLTQAFGVYNPIYLSKYHTGEDYAALGGRLTPDPELYAPPVAKVWEVVYARHDQYDIRGNGQRVILRGQVDDKIIELGFSHLGRLAFDGIPSPDEDYDGIFVKEGQKINFGEAFGRMGNTGNIIPIGEGDGRHTHVECREFDLKGNLLNADNGFNGRIDPSPYIEKTLTLPNEENYMLAFLHEDPASKTNTVYVPVFSKFVGIADENTFLELGGQWNQVKKVTDAEFESIIKPYLAEQTILK